MNTSPEQLRSNLIKELVSLVTELFDTTTLHYSSYKSVTKLQDVVRRAAEEGRDGLIIRELTSKSWTLYRFAGILESDTLACISKVKKASETYAALLNDKPDHNEKKVVLVTPKYGYTPFSDYEVCVSQSLYCMSEAANCMSENVTRMLIEGYLPQGGMTASTVMREVTEDTAEDGYKVGDMALFYICTQAMIK